MNLKKGVFPFNPAGPIRECFYTYLEGDFSEDFYIALMADGSLKYWENWVNEENIFLWIFSGLLSIALSFIVAVIISVIYLIKYLVQLIQRKIRERNQQQLTSAPMDGGSASGGTHWASQK